MPKLIFAGLVRRIPFHLFFPLAASIIFAFGALFLKRAAVSGIRPWNTVFLSNILASIFFSGFWGFGGTFPGIEYLWQPFAIAVLYLCGQILILSAVSYGDVSVATPVASIKVVVVAVLLTVFTSTSPNAGVWISAALATIGVGLINFNSPEKGQKEVLLTVVLAFSGAATFALFDVCIQSWSPVWSPERDGAGDLERLGRLVPISYWFVAIFSLGLVPFCQRSPTVLKTMAWPSWCIGSLFVAIQAMCLVISVSIFGDAARINVVYSLRGLWGVVFAWTFAEAFRGRESEHSRQVMHSRLVGAILLVIAVVVAIVFGDSP